MACAWWPRRPFCELLGLGLARIRAYPPDETDRASRVVVDRVPSQLLSSVLGMSTKAITPRLADRHLRREPVPPGRDGPAPTVEGISVTSDRHGTSSP